MVLTIFQTPEKKSLLKRWKEKNVHLQDMYLVYDYTFFFEENFQTKTCVCIERLKRFNILVKQ